jgi:hypothetical protein
LQCAARKVIEENKLLREVLGECGLSPAEIDRRVNILREQKRAEEGCGKEEAGCMDNGCGSAGEKELQLGCVEGSEMWKGGEDDHDRFFREFELPLLPTSSIGSVLGDSPVPVSVGIDAGAVMSGMSMDQTQIQPTPNIDTPNFLLDVNEFLEDVSPSTSAHNFLTKEEEN